MPEGDTLFRTAHTLRLALAGRVVTRFHSPLPSFREIDLAGLTVTDTEARGKNLLIFFEDGRALYSHLRMEGSWHIYRPGVPWQKPLRLAKVVLETAEYIAVCFNAPVVEMLTATGIKRHPTLSRLGPDLLKENFDVSIVTAHLRAHNAVPLGEAVMKQTILAGIGNIYKSEFLFLCAADPFAPVSAYSDRELKHLIALARRLMQQNLTGQPRTTRNALDRGRHWVYGRRGRPCRKCGTVLRMRRQGVDGRSTVWCTRCQPHRDKRTLAVSEP